MPYEPTTALEVRAWGQTVGAVSATHSGYALQYTPSWKRRGVGLSPLLMPTADRRTVFAFRGLNEQTFHGLPPMIAGALPDRFGNSLVDAWLASPGIDRTQIISVGTSAGGARAKAVVNFNAETQGIRPG